ncbi:metallophosphoesterase 1 isoform X2 [Alligator sinensis]|uniref:Metallophosphoesterase 1 n=1 Tax=Alligator sinensis TaxID=38654 RepID=A0A1U8DML1_ALLSI|nr:metallophosphoesterase 1 isoform X2 [Alligator sinensis]
MLRFSSGMVKNLPLKKRVCFLLMLVCLACSVLIFCEFLIYYVVIFQCYWPEAKTDTLKGSRQTSASVLKAMFLSDTHLLGEIKGHWLDKLRREWQMERAFQTALLLQPDVVFILGDVFDEGKWSRSQAWADDVRRFQKMFRHPAETELVVIVGNHDIGFHYEMTTYKLKRFEKVFNFTPEMLVTRKGVKNRSIPAEGAERWNSFLFHSQSFYRRSDSECTGEDSAPPEEKNIPFKEKYDVLSQEASQKLIWWFHPRLILSGHTHSACEVLHDGKILEVSVPSFSWRNRNNPSFIMGSITPTNFSLQKCFLPFESRVFTIYCAAGALLVVLLLAHFLMPSFYFAQRLISKHKAV